MKDTCTPSIAAYLPRSLTTAISMAESNACGSEHDSESSLSESLGTKNIQTKSMVPGSFRGLPQTESRKNLSWVNGKQFIWVDHAANVRMNSAVSEIWQHGIELRLAGNLSEKFWRCNYCNRAGLFSVQGGTNAAICHLRKKHKTKIGKGKDVERLGENTSSSKSLTI
jgi:hypothetical protein